MLEKRKEKRMPITLSLEISNLYKQDNVLVDHLNAPIEVVDISKSGIGFISQSVIPIGYYFNANINLGNDSDIIHCVVKVIWKEQAKDNYTHYGCEFVGMASILSYIFEEYDKSLGE
jgi:hypothetical protein